MITNDTLIKVRNRANGSVGYTLDNNFHRNFEHKEIKMIPFGELRQLQYAPGGEYALQHLLVVEDEEALKLLNMKVEPEYFYSEDNIKDLLLKGEIDAFADFLDFAPDGALDLAKTIAIREEIPDVRKREMLGEKIGLNINNAIMVNKVMNENSEEAEEEAPKQRRIQINDDIKSDKTPTRRTEAPKYKIVSK